MDENWCTGCDSPIPLVGMTTQKDVKIKKCNAWLEVCKITTKHDIYIYNIIRCLKFKPVWHFKVGRENAYYVIVVQNSWRAWTRILNTSLWWTLNNSAAALCISQVCHPALLLHLLSIGEGECKMASAHHVSKVSSWWLGFHRKPPPLSAQQQQWQTPLPDGHPNGLVMGLYELLSSPCWSPVPEQLGILSFLYSFPF